MLPGIKAPLAAVQGLPVVAIADVRCGGARCARQATARGRALDDAAVHRRAASYARQRSRWSGAFVPDQDIQSDRMAASGWMGEPASRLAPTARGAVRAQRSAVVPARARLWRRQAGVADRDPESTIRSVRRVRRAGADPVRRTGRGSTGCGCAGTACARRWPIARIWRCRRCSISRRGTVSRSPGR